MLARDPVFIRTGRATSRQERGWARSGHREEAHYTLLPGREEGYARTMGGVASVCDHARVMSRPLIVNCALCRLAASGLFCQTRGAGPEPSHSALVFRRGQTLFSAGTPALALFVIRSGRVKVCTAGRDGRSRVVNVAGPGETLGYRSLLAGGPYGTSAEAMEPTEACVISRQAVREMILASPNLAMELLQRLARQSTATEALRAEPARRPVKQRAAGLLLTLMKGGDQTDQSGVVVTHGLMRRDLADLAGTTPETLSRVLRGLGERGVLKVTRTEIVVRDAAALRRIARAGPIG
jgi:CRP/FNR family transcriptional regulator